MPIRINLLAEAQALEEERRRDPVKRVWLIGSILLVLLVFWSCLLWFNSIAAKSDLSRLESDLNSRTNDYRQIIESQKRLNESNARLADLQDLATNRFLYGNLLEALQKNTVDNVQLMRLKVSQTYTSVTQEDKTKPKPGAPKPEKIVKITEKTTLTLEAKDTSAAGDGYTAFQEKLSHAPYFLSILGKNSFRLAFLGPPQSDPEGKTFVLFTLEARLPEKTR